MKLSQGVPVEKALISCWLQNMLHFAWNNLRRGHLVSGDGDFAYALQPRRTWAKHVEVAYFESNISKSMLDVATTGTSDQEFFKGLWRAGISEARRGRKGPRRPTGPGDSLASAPAGNSASSVRRRVPGLAGFSRRAVSAAESVWPGGGVVSSVIGQIPNFPSYCAMARQVDVRPIRPDDETGCWPLFLTLIRPQTVYLRFIRF